MILGLALILAVAVGDADSPNIWLAEPGGKLTRSGREGEPLQVFDVSPKPGAFVFRGRQLAYAEGGSLTWITGSNQISRSPAAGKHVVGWRETDPLVWDGAMLATLAGQKAPLELRGGDSPVFSCFFGSAGTIVSRTASGTIRVAVTGAPPLAADFGAWTLSEARMVTATSGYLVLEGAGSAVVRIAKGRAEIVAMDRDSRLGIAVASDGRIYLVRHPLEHGDTQAPITTVDEIGASPAPTPCCRLRGALAVVDIDRTRKCAYVVETGAGAYMRVRYGSLEEPVVLKRVAFVLPAWGGVGYVSAPTTPQP